MQYITTKTLFRLRVLLLSGTIAIIAIVFIDIYVNSSKPGSAFNRRGSKGLENQQGELKNADEMLHARLWQLQDLDQQFASQMNTQYDQNALARTNVSIQSSEEAFRKSIDSVARIGSSYDDQSGTNDFQNMTTFFKKILENRRFIAFTRMGILAGGGGSGSEKQTILKLQNELYEKEKLIASSANNKTVISLQDQLDEKDKKIATLEAEIQKGQTEKQNFAQTTQKLQNEISEKDKIITSLGARKTAPDDKLIAKLQTEANAKNTQISNLQAQAQSDKQTYNQNLQKLQTELKEKDKTIASFANRTTSEDKKAFATLQNEVNVKNKQISDLQTQVQKEQADKRTYTQSIAKFQNDIAEKNKMINALSNIKIPTDDKAIASLQKEVSDKNKQISELQNQVTEKDRAIAAAATNRVATNQKGVASLQNEVNSKNSQIAALQADLKKESDDKKEYSKLIQVLQQDLIAKNKIIAAGNSKVPADQKAVLTLQSEIAEKDRRIRRLEEQLQSNSGNRAIHTSNVSTQENNNLRLAYNNTMTQLGVLQKKYNLLKAEMDQLKGQR